MYLIFVTDVKNRKGFFKLYYSLKLSLDLKGVEHKFSPYRLTPDGRNDEMPTPISNGCVIQLLYACMTVCVSSYLMHGVEARGKFTVSVC